MVWFLRFLLRWKKIIHRLTVELAWCRVVVVVVVDRDRERTAVPCCGLPISSLFPLFARAVLF